MDTALWFIVLGLLFLFISISHSWVERVPLTTSLIYLIIGVLLGPYGIGLLDLHIEKNTKLLEHLTEIAVIISLFNAGLKLRLPLAHKFWRLPLGLATVSMVASVSLIALSAHLLFDFDWGLAILLGAILSPTDPVLASDVQVKRPGDNDQLRFTLTCEAGLNDASAFPFVMLGLALMGVTESQNVIQNWVLVDLIWAILGGVGTGMGVGFLMAWFDKKIKPKVSQVTILNDFLALALISLSYGIAIAIKSYGFLAVFVAGVMVRQLEMKVPFWKLKGNFGKVSDGVLFFNEQFERLWEVGIVIILGAMLRWNDFSQDALILGFLLALIIRPLSVFLIGILRREKLSQLGYISWFGIRGIGSLYYLSYAIAQGVPREMSGKISSLTLSLVAASIFIHGLSATPLMNYKSRLIK